MSDPGKRAGDGDESAAAYGTAALDAPVTRADLERALRHLNLADLELRDGLMQLGARVVALVDELTRRVDGVEPEPAPPGTPAEPAAHTVEHAVARLMPQTLAAVRAADVHGTSRVIFDTVGVSKYEAEPSTPPCDELLHLCQARCCTFDFALSTEDLDEGIVRWDYGQPYRIRQRASDRFCVHNDPTTRGCTIHARRPRPCRTYDCAKDPRVWIDYERRIPAPPEAALVPPAPTEADFDLMARVRARSAAVAAERTSVASSWADPGPRRGPAPSG
jgi:Fe-S-cluster containining protein